MKPPNWEAFLCIFEETNHQFMKKFIFALIITAIPLLLSAQNSDASVINGKTITDKSGNTKNLPSEPEDVVNYFYTNISDIKKLDKVISFRFYQKTPAYKFKEIMAIISNANGEFLSKEIVSHKYSPDKKSVIYIIKVTYEKQITKETLILIQENPNDRFEVYEYQLKKA